MKRSLSPRLFGCERSVVGCCRFVLTQYNSFMLNSHLATCYPPVVMSNPAKQGFVDVLACHQTIQGTGWYRGSADAVRQNMPTILDITTLGEEPRDVLVLSGHAVYDMASPARLLPYPVYA